MCPDRLPTRPTIMDGPLRIPHCMFYRTTPGLTRPSHLFVTKWVTGAVRIAPETAWDNSASQRSSVDDAASVGLQLPETAAAWSKLVAVPASSTGSTCDGPRSAPMGAARIDAGQRTADWNQCARLTWLLKATYRSTVVDNHRANERQDASDVQTLNNRQSSTSARSHTSAAGLDFIKLTTTARSAT